jgi:hypothetical protein
MDSILRRHGLCHEAVNVVREGCAPSDPSMPVRVLSRELDANLNGDAISGALGRKFRQ